MKTTYYKINEFPLNKIALVSDLHDRSGKKVIEILEKEKPVAIMLAGDIFNGNKDFEKQENALSFLKACVDIAPTYLTKGNHCKDAKRSDITVPGIHFVTGYWEEIKPGVLLAGTIEGEKLPKGWFEKAEKMEGYKILLVHYPMECDVVDLVLCGHSHGGQWRIGKRGVYVPRYGLFPKLAYGRVGNTIITSGCANTAIVPRLGNPKEVVIITPSKQ